MTKVPLRRQIRQQNFNPHEREARDVADIGYWARSINFNPHEREARDVANGIYQHPDWILIHTSVKLVTKTPMDTI